MMNLRTVTLTVALLLVASSGSAADFRGWRFGMSKASVRGVRDCSPYTEVRSTGGLQCKNFRFLGATLNISFIFDLSGLKKIQIWAYQGRSPELALKRLDALLKQMKATYGSLTSPKIPTIGQMTRKQLRELIQQMRRSPSLVRYNFKPATNPKKTFVFCSLYHHPTHGFFLFFYVQPPRRPPRL